MPILDLSGRLPNHICDPPTFFLNIHEQFPAQYRVIAGRIYPVLPLAHHRPLLSAKHTTDCRGGGSGVKVLKFQTETLPASAPRARESFSAV